MEQPSQALLIDAVLTGNVHNIVARFLDGKWGLLPSVWNVPFEDVIAEGKHRGMECFINARPIHEGYWLSQNDSGFCVQYFERGTNSDHSQFSTLESAFRQFIQSQLNYFQLKVLP